MSRDFVEEMALSGSEVLKGSNPNGMRPVSTT